MVYGDKYNKTGIKDWPKPVKPVERDNWFLKFEDENDVTTETSSKQEGEPNINNGVNDELSSKQEGAQIKRKRGRPKKSIEIKATNENEVKTDIICDKTINDTSFSDIPQGQTDDIKALFVTTDKLFYKFKDDINHALLCKINNDPLTFEEAMNSNESHLWELAILQELKSLYKNKVWKIVNRPNKSKEGKMPNIIDSKWVFKRKIDKDGKIKYKALLVVRGFKDKNCYDLTETYAPVSRLAVVRMVLSIINKLKLKSCQLDVKTAFLNGSINEEIYMEIPEGTEYTKELKQSHVCKIEKALYGLRISPKRWYERLTKALNSIGLKSDDDEPCLFVSKDGQNLLLLVIYVDDMIIACNNDEKLNYVKSKLKGEFELTDMGEPKEFLGITINHDKTNNIMKLSPENYINKLLKRFDNGALYPQRTPMITSQVANRERKEREQLYDEATLKATESSVNFPYREAIGSLLYLANATKPDISYAVNVLSRHQINPIENDWKMVIWVLRYLKGTTKLALTFKGNDQGIEVFSDASYADCKKSLTTCGFVVRIFGDSIVWKTQKQKYVALPTCQAEYVTMSLACQEVISVHKNLIFALRTSFYPIILQCDKQAAIKCAKGKGNNKLRHIVEAKEHYVKQCVEFNLVKISWIRSKDQLADIFTKSLSFDTHKRLTNLIMNEINEKQ